ncbi:mycothiol transferase [Actinotalea fermentans]|uniref:DinB-like domain-containing protein n=1 Tax=Actinotalea fermentans TaxID=43671 RepID=A0A511YY97_9CELL|nr:DinB family protein [Actinotalea fermentans]KGM14931.1 chorismate synthase [Actinotalea fermentans ATCC 43279 = JCM 9966 = DSM 3133]GEN80159.1 hypothetical protein AFE02nite_18930 [Actinotalea fermentans]
MDVAELLTDAYGRVHEEVHRVLDGLDPALLGARVDPGANSIAWLVWHLTRVQDDHVADAFGTQQVWTADGWADRLALSFDPSATGYGQSRADVDALAAVPADLLLGYHDAVHARTLGLLGQVRAGDLDRVVDTRWDPPVTLGVRLVSVLSDDLQHVGQAAYARGVLRRSATP